MACLFVGTDLQVEKADTKLDSHFLIRLNQMIIAMEDALPQG